MVKTNQPSLDMRRDFNNRRELIAYAREQFPEAAAVDDHVTETRGGRQAADQALRRARTGRTYAKTRNHLDGAVSRLSPYLRHGVLSLAEARDAALKREHQPGESEKFITELGWRDYYQRIYAGIGNGIWSDREPYKMGLRPEDYADDLPEDIREGRTGLACIDAFRDDLVSTGYMHNHARMWTAAYVIHWRRVKWQAGARWFLEHLLDGDPASNNLSWQWVASTFSHKPYIFNRDNLERFSDGRYCRDCPARRHCPFDGDYEDLEQRLFVRP
jgi:deoxyribodipyrimidine photo-lyase